MLQVRFVLVLSAAALAAGVTPGAMALVSGVVWNGSDWAVQGIAATITAMLLNCIRNEWDLVTWLAPRPDSADLFDRE